MTQPAIFQAINAVEPYASKSAEVKQGWVVDFTEAHQYQENVINETGEPIPNPESRAEFGNRMIVEFIKRVINGWRQSKAQEAIVIEEMP